MFFPSNKYLWISKISLVSIGLKSKEKKFTAPFNPVFFFILVIVKSFEILPKHSDFRVFCFELISLCSINKQETVASIIVWTK